MLKSDNALKAIEMIFEMYIMDMMNDKHNRGCMITNCKSEMANHEAAITSFLCANEKQTLEFFEDLISQGQKASLINEEQSAKDYALFLFSSLQGMRMTSILVNDKTHLRGISKMILQTLS